MISGSKRPSKWYSATIVKSSINSRRHAPLSPAPWFGSPRSPVLPLLSTEHLRQEVASLGRGCEQMKQELDEARAEKVSSPSSPAIGPTVANGGGEKSTPKPAADSRMQETTELLLQATKQVEVRLYEKYLCFTWVKLTAVKTS